MFIKTLRILLHNHYWMVGLSVFFCVIAVLFFYNLHTLRFVLI